MFLRRTKVVGCGRNLNQTVENRSMVEIKMMVQKWRKLGGKDRMCLWDKSFWKVQSFIKSILTTSFFFIFAHVAAVACSLTMIRLPLIDSGINVCFCFIHDAELSCQICRQVMTNPLTTPCAHNFCKACLEDFFAGQSFVRQRTCEGRRTLRVQKNVMKCPACTNDIADFLQNPQVLQLS